MEQIVVKTEMEGGDILLFYVDEADGNTVETAIPIGNIQNVTDIQNIADLQNFTQVQALPDNTAYIMEEAEESADEEETIQSPNQAVKEKWLSDETSRLLMFYIDNKEIFQSGATKVKHLWSVACKTMLSDKSPASCEKKIRAMKRKYAHVRAERQKGINLKFPHIDLCHKAFHDDNFVNMVLKENLSQPSISTIKVPTTPQPNNDGIVVVKSIPAAPRTSDNKVENMLNLYIQYQKEFQKEYWRKDLWDRIAMELGEEDADYWHKRFLNYKQHYLRMLSKRSESGPESINWPYMALFDQIFKDDKEFQKRVTSKPNKPINIVANNVRPINADNWNTTEMTILIKYTFDCFDEFQDTTIPNKFLWSEIGRLIDKKSDLCQQKYEELRNEHLDKYIECQYELRNRSPLAILLDNVIAKGTEVELGKERKKQQVELWDTQDLDNLVKHFYDNIEMFKDPICYFVCWASIAKKLNRSVYHCGIQWEELTILYKSILDEKKEDSDLQIDWRYIELFDRIFDYGMDTNLLEALAKIRAKNAIVIDTEKIDVKKVNINIDNDNMENGTDDEEYDEKDFVKRSKRGIGDSKAFKILEFFQKNKDKFSTTQRKKQALWDILAKQIGISAEQCAHRFRNLKQVYTGYVQREIDKPEMPILWPYYALCKKVFGYRAIKSKLKNNKASEDEDWSAKEIKQVINYFKQNFSELAGLANSDSTKWSLLAKEIGKSERSCMEKFVELRKSYRKLKTMKANNADVKVSWKYFNLFDEIYKSKMDGYEESEPMEVDEKHTVDPGGDRTDSQEEDDYQCIIVIPEGQDISDIENIKSTQIVIQPKAENPTEPPQKPLRKWTKLTKKRLLIHYLNYIRARKGKEIDPVEMWKEIASKLPEKTALSCRKVFAKLKSMRSTKDDVNKKKSPYFKLMGKILALKPKFVKKGQKTLQEGRTYKDVPLPTGKVEQALQYYLLHLEEFVSPRFDKKHLWTELANFVSEPITKVFNKVNYLKQFYNIETDEVCGEKTLFGELLKEIVTKEVAFKAISDDPKPIEDQGIEHTWSDNEAEQLLIWYLANLEQFKDPKYSRKYLWSEAASILNKSPLACSKKMTEIRTQYRNMVKENSEGLSSWKFYSLCQKIYGTGKKNDAEIIDVK